MLPSRRIFQDLKRWIAERLISTENPFLKGNGIRSKKLCQDKLENVRRETEDEKLFDPARSCFSLVSSMPVPYSSFVLFLFRLTSSISRYSLPFSVLRLPSYGFLYFFFIFLKTSPPPKRPAPRRMMIEGSGIGRLGVCGSTAYAPATNPKTSSG